LLDELLFEATIDIRRELRPAPLRGSQRRLGRSVEERESAIVALLTALIDERPLRQILSADV